MQALKDDGRYIINDPKGLSTPAQNIAEAPQHAAMMFGISCHCCLPSGALSAGQQMYGNVCSDCSSSCKLQGHACDLMPQACQRPRL